MTRKQSATAPSVTPVILEDLADGGLKEFTQPDAIIEGYGFSHLAADTIRSTGARYSLCRIADLHGELTFVNATFAETRFEHLDVPTLRATRSGWRDIELERSRLGYLELCDVAWRSVRVTGCKLGYVNLRGAKLQDVLFADCTIDELDLSNGEALRVCFTDTTIARLTIPQARLRHVDLRGAELSELSGIESLRGTTINETQLITLAPLLAAHLGIHVTDN